MSLARQKIRNGVAILGNVIRTELDGCRVYSPNNSQVWLMINGERRFVVSSQVYDALFSEAHNLVPLEDYDEIKLGPELNNGTCLMRGEGENPVYLVTGSPALFVRKHHIFSPQTFLDFGFDENKVRIVPAIVADAVPEGRPLRSAADRE